MKRLRSLRMPDTPSLVNLYKQQKQKAVPSLVAQKKPQKKPESLMGKVGDALTTVTDAYNWPQQKMMGELVGENKADGDKVLEKAGMGQGLARSAGGLAIDLIADPMNLVPSSWIGKGIKGVSEGLKLAHGAAEAIPGVNKIVKLGDEFAQGAEKLFV